MAVDNTERGERSEDCTPTRVCVQFKTFVRSDELPLLYAELYTYTSKSEILLFHLVARFGLRAVGTCEISKRFLDFSGLFHFEALTF